MSINSDENVIERRSRHSHHARHSQNTIVLTYFYWRQDEFDNDDNRNVVKLKTSPQRG